jgi:triacylglycerol lipase
MAAQNAKAPSAKRFHTVLIPGFAGFDALGQLEYYAGLTPLFQSRGADDEVLHYFDDYPTAAVETRAARLQKYLAKRIARGDISPGDEVTLVGHSTGGLDIRWLLWKLHHRSKAAAVDGGCAVDAEKILHAVRRVVFLSVPHWGTNIADWVRAHGIGRLAVVADLRAAVAGSQLLPVDWLERTITGAAACLTGADLLLAMQDALSEANEYNGVPGPLRKAEAHEAAAQLALYLRDIASDFRAIDDLTSLPPRTGEIASPAHFDRRDRDKEMKLLGNLEFRSYLTLGKRPFRFPADEVAPPWELAKPCTYPEIMKDAALSAGTDIAYRAGYRACAGGPFDERPVPRRKVTRRFQGAPQDQIEKWDNDGIVNTLSMFWPKDENVLVAADHMDIVGHYKLVPAQPGEGRNYRAYDLLKSASGFDEKIFEEIWKEIFEFCRG